MIRSATNRSERGPKLSVGFLLARNFTLSAFALFVDTLRLAADEGDRSRRIACTWDVLSSREATHRSSCGVAVTPTALLNDGRQYDYIAVVGGLLDQGPAFDAATIAFLHKSARTTPLVGVCTGSFALAEAGLLNGHAACVSWFHHRDFRNAFPEIHVVADRIYVVDGMRITCAGGTGAADVAAYLVAKSVGTSAARKAAQILQIEHTRLGREPQSRMSLGVSVSDDRLARALLLMEQNLSEPLPLTEIAEQVGLSLRQLQRLSEQETGLTPNAHYNNIRLRFAQTLLCNTNRNLLEIALESGFALSSTFSRCFRGKYGCTPSDWRRQVRAASAFYDMARPAVSNLIDRYPSSELRSFACD